MKRISKLPGAAAILWGLMLATAGCANHHLKPYGEERQLFLPGDKQLVWAVAPTVNLSGEPNIDALLVSDQVFGELQQVHGLNVLPVNRVVEVYAALKMDKVETEAQAFAVCDQLGCDGLVVPTITQWDPYDPPKVAASLVVFLKPGSYRQVQNLDPHALDRAATAGPAEPMRPHWTIQAIGIYDAADGTTRDRINEYALGRSDPNGAFAARELYQSMDRYCSFVYHELIIQLMEELRPMVAPLPSAGA